MHVRCVTHIPPDHVELREVEVREPSAGEVLVEAAYTGISPGTELRMLRTGEPDRAYIPGYALAGTVIRCGPGVTGLEGARVLVQGTRDTGGLERLYGGHASHAIVAASELCPLPPAVDLVDASVCRMAAIAYHGLKLSRPLAGERVAVVGLGLIGQIAARLHQLSGAWVTAADPSAHRVKVALSAGLEAVQVRGTLEETFRPHMPEGADLIVDATGAPQVVVEAIAIGRNVPWDNAPFTGVRYLVQGSYADGFTVPYQDAFAKEISFLLPRDHQRRDLDAVLTLVARRKLAVRDLVEVRRPDDAADVYARLRDPESALLTAAFDWRGPA